MGKGGELKKGGATTERGRQQKTVVGLSQAILSMLNWDAVRGKRRTRAQQKGRVTPCRKAHSRPSPESPRESPSETPHEPQPDPRRNHPARTRTRPPGCPKSRSSEAQSAFCNALGGVELADGYFSDRLPLRKARATHTQNRESPPNCYFPAMASISTRAPLGRAATW